MKFSKKKAAGLVSGALALALVAGSWAFFSNTSTIDNNVFTKSYGNRTVEEFTPDQEWEPGTEINKVVNAKNTGDYNLVVRIKMNEEWLRGGTSLIDFASSDAEFGSVVKAGSAPSFTYTATQGGATDGLLTGDESVVYKNLDLTDWMDGGDGYWYYKSELIPGASTSDLLKSVILADNTDLGKYDTKEFYTTVSKTNATLVAAIATRDAAEATYLATPNAANKTALDTAEAALETAYAWVAVPTGGFPSTFDQTTITYRKSDNNLDSTAAGYADANYKLSVVTEVCQATEDAVTATWTADPLPAAVKTAWGW